MNSEKDNRINQVIKTEATTSDISDFMITHVPFKNLYIGTDFVSSVTEDDLLDNYLKNNPDKHKFMLVQGDNGSGKSHLIRWLKEMYEKTVDPKREKVLIISRAHNTLQDALQQILNSDIFPESIRENEIKKINDTKSNDSGESLKKFINYNLYSEIEKDSKTKESLIIDERKRDWLKSFIWNDYVKTNFLMQNNGPLERIREKIEKTDENSVNMSEDPVFTPNDFKISLEQIRVNMRNAEKSAETYAINMADEFARGKMREECAEYLNSKVSRVIQQSLKLNSGDFRNLFSVLRQSLKNVGIQLSLFIEDINSFTGIDQALMEVLLTDHEANQDMCRLMSVVGSTTAFYKNRLNDSIKERVTCNILIKEQSILGTREQLVYFAAKYINAIKLSKGTVEDWYQNGSLSNYPISPPENEWSKTTSNGETLSLFPFNETAIWNLYCALPSERRTPRAFLRDILQNLLRQWYYDEEQFLKNEARLTSVGITLPRFKDRVFDDDNKRMDPSTSIERSIILRVWGDATTDYKDNNYGGLQLSVFDDLHIYYNPEFLKNSAEATGYDVGEETDKPKVEEVSEEVKNSSKFEKFRDDIEDWYVKGNPLLNHREFRDIICDFILSSFDWKSEDIPTNIANSFITKNYVHIEGQSVSQKVGITLPKNSDTYKFLYALLSWSLRGDCSWSFSKSEYELTCAMSWLENNRESILLLVRNPIKIQNTGLYYVASLYVTSTFWGGLNKSKSDEEIYKNLFSKMGEIRIAEQYEPETKVIVENIAKDYKEIFEESRKYFSRTVGGRQFISTSYTFIDVFDVIKCIRKLREMKWDLSNLETGATDANDSIWSLNSRFVDLYTHGLNSAVSKQRDFLKSIKTYFENLLCGEDISKKSIQVTLNSVHRFMQFARADNYPGFKDSDFVKLQESVASEFIEQLLNQLIEIENTPDNYDFFSKLSICHCDHLIGYQTELIRFSDFLKRKKLEYSTGINQHVVDIFKEKKVDIIYKLEKLTSATSKAKEGVSN